MEKIYRINCSGAPSKDQVGVLIADDYWKEGQRMDETFKKDAEEIERFFKGHVSVSTIGELKGKHIGEFLEYLSEHLGRESHVFEQVKSFYESKKCQKLLVWGKTSI